MISSYIQESVFSSYMIKVRLVEKKNIMFFVVGNGFIINLSNMCLSIQNVIIENTAVNIFLMGILGL